MYHWLHTVKGTMLCWLHDSFCHCHAIWLGLMVWNGFLDLVWRTESSPSLLHAICIFLLLSRKSYWDSLLKITLVPSSFCFTLHVLESRIRNSVTYPLMWLGIRLLIWGLTLPLWQNTLVEVTCNSGQGTLCSSLTAVIHLWFTLFIFLEMSCIVQYLRFQILKCAGRSGMTVIKTWLKRRPALGLKSAIYICIASHSIYINGLRLESAKYLCWVPLQNFWQLLYLKLTDGKYYFYIRKAFCDFIFCFKLEKQPDG